MERLTGVVQTLGAADDDEEVRTLVVRTLVVESAQAAGLACAQPVNERSQGTLLVYGAADGPGAGLRARVVRLAGGRARGRSRGARAGSAAGGVAGVARLE